MSGQTEMALADLPSGATHMRRPEYLTAWLFDRKSVMPTWLIEKYQSRPLPDDKIGHYATAVDGEFWRWLDPAKFDEMYVAALRRPAPTEPDIRAALEAALAEHDHKRTQQVMLTEPRWVAQARAAISPAPVCPGGVDPGFDECPKCGATMDEGCKFADSPAGDTEREAEPVAWRYKCQDGSVVLMLKRLTDSQKARGYYTGEDGEDEVDGDEAVVGPFHWAEETPLYASPLPAARIGREGIADIVRTLRNPGPAVRP